jgi:hypothetical protein
MILTESAASEAMSLIGRLVVSGLFIGCCCVGIILALYPGWFRKITRKETSSADYPNELPRRSFSGHHPDCAKFRTHRLAVRNKTWCAGCLGLLLGSLFSILLTVMYLSAEIKLPRSTYILLFCLGLALVMVTIMETVASEQAAAHLFFNAMLVPGFFLITMSVTEVSGKTSFGVITVLLCALWLNTRVTVSAWRNRRTCSLCPEPCKMYKRAASSASRSL